MRSAKIGVKEIYNHAWIKNWGFVPLTEAEIDDMARILKPIIVPDLILLAYWGEEPVGISVSLPDYNKVFKHLNGKIGFLGDSNSFIPQERLRPFDGCFWE